MARIQYICMLIFTITMLFVAARFVPDWSVGDNRLFHIFLADPAQNIFTLSYSIPLVFAAYWSSKAARMGLIAGGAVLVLNATGYILVDDLFSHKLLGMLNDQLVLGTAHGVDALLMTSFGLMMVYLGLFCAQDQQIHLNARQSVE